MTCELKCSRADMPRVPCLTRLAQPRDHLPTCFASSVSRSAIVAEVVHTVGKL